MPATGMPLEKALLSFVLLGLIMVLESSGSGKQHQEWRRDPHAQQQRLLKGNCRGVVCCCPWGRRGFLYWGIGCQSSDTLHGRPCRKACSLVISLLCLQLKLIYEHRETYPWTGSAKGLGTGLTLTMEKVTSNEAGFSQSSELLQIPLQTLLLQSPFLCRSTDPPQIHLASSRRWITWQVTPPEQHVSLISSRDSRIYLCFIIHCWENICDVRLRQVTITTTYYHHYHLHCHSNWEPQPRSQW